MLPRSVTVVGLSGSVVQKCLESLCSTLPPPHCESSHSETWRDFSDEQGSKEQRIVRAEDKEMEKGGNSPEESQNNEVGTDL